MPDFADATDITSNTGARFQAMPQAGSQIATANGTITNVWYRYLETLWRMVCSGTENTTTLYTTNATATTANTTATDATTTANNAAAAVVTEENRAKAAESSLQSQINSINSSIGSLQSQINGLQSQINTINSRLAAAGIP